MQRLKYDPEILYVQKLYFFIFLMGFVLLASGIIWWRYGLTNALIVLGLGLVSSYAFMVGKKSFPPPEKKLTAKRMAKEISQDTSPLAIARFASQQYFYLNQPVRAILLLERFLPTHDPLLYATLGDILLKEGRPRQALSILRENPLALTDPLLLATQGHVLKHMGKIPEAAKMYERSLRIAKEGGFPHNGAHWLTQRFLTLSYTANIHHTLADCYNILKDFPAAKRHYWAGNRRFLDISFWQYPKGGASRFAKKHTESR